MTDENNIVVWEAVYLPFGQAIVNPNSRVENNFRLPGQYYDKETGFHYNWHRYYSPAIGRYLRSDPIGLRGGLNLFLYADGNPVMGMDVRGLRILRCKKPLDFLGGDGQRSGPDIPGNPLFHEYICIQQGKGRGSMTCGGQCMSGGAWPWGKGRACNDTPLLNWIRCDDLGTDRCVESCLLKKFNGQRPDYGLFLSGTNCQEWASKILKECKIKCEKFPFCPIK